MVAVRPMDNPLRWSASVMLGCHCRAYHSNDDPDILQARQSGRDYTTKETQGYNQASNDSKCENDSICARTNRGSLMDIVVHYMN